MIEDQRLLQLMSDVFEVPLDQIDETTTPATLDKWDSLRHIKLVLALEDEFGVKFEEKEFLELQSFKLIRLMLNEKLG